MCSRVEQSWFQWVMISAWVAQHNSCQIHKVHAAGSNIQLPCIVDESEYPNQERSREVSNTAGF